MSVAFGSLVWQNGIQMKRNNFANQIILLLVCFFVGACGFLKGKSDVKTIRIGLQPTDGEKSVELLRAELSRRLNAEVSFVISKDYSDLVEKFKKKELDFAFFTALNFIKAEQEAGAKALLKKVYGKDEFYYSALVTLVNSGIKGAGDLKGKRVGFVDPKSTSGYFYPRLMLNGLGFEKESESKSGVKPEFFGTHEKALQALLDKKVDFVGVWSSSPQSGEGAWTEFAKHNSAFDAKMVKVLKYSDPIPNDAFAVRDDYFKSNPMQVYQVMETLIGISEEPDGVLKKTLNVERLATATSRHYDSVRELENLLKQEK
jgi:phosphonate transport system substrate-binding protein